MSTALLGLAVTNMFRLGNVSICVTLYAMAKPKSVEKRSRQANWQRKQKAIGLCPRCGDPCDFNQKTGKPYYYDAKCRALINPGKARLMKSRRASALS